MFFCAALPCPLRSIYTCVRSDCRGSGCLFFPSASPFSESQTPRLYLACSIVPLLLEHAEYGVRSDSRVFAYRGSALISPFVTGHIFFFAGLVLLLLDARHWEPSLRGCQMYFYKYS